MKTSRAIVLFSCLGLVAMACSLFGLIGRDSAPAPAATVLPENSYLNEAGEFVQLKPPPPDMVDLMEERIETGEVSREQAILDHLGYLAGELNLNQLYPDQEVLVDSGFGLTALAGSLYLQTDDAEVRAELERLHGKIAPSTEAMAPYAAPEEEFAAAAAGTLARRLNPVQTEACRSIWDLGFPRDPEEPILCLLHRTFSAGESTFRIYYPLEHHEDPSFMAYVSAAEEALVRSHETYSPLTPMRDVNLIFTLTPPDGVAGPGPMAAIPVLDPATHGDRPCPLLIFPRGIGESIDYFKQTVAHEMFHCADYWHRGRIAYEGDRWYTEGMATHFSNVVYPNVNSEHVRFQQPFDIISMYRNMAQISYPSYVFFQYLDNEFGQEYLIDLLDMLPNGGDEGAQLAGLASVPNMETIFHEFGQAYLSKKIPDSGGGLLPIQIYVPIDADFQVNRGTEMAHDSEQFVLDRSRITFNQCGEFDIVKDEGGGDGRHSWRERNDSGFTEVPATVRSTCEHLQYYLLLTTIESRTELGMQVDLVEDGRCDCCLIGMWQQDTSEIANNLSQVLASGGASLDELNGRFLLTITGDGTMVFWPEGYAGTVTLDGKTAHVSVVGSAISTFVLDNEDDIIKPITSAGGFLVTVTHEDGSVTIPIDAGGMGGAAAGASEFPYTCTETTFTAQIPAGAAPFSSSSYSRISEPVRTPTPEPLDVPPGEPGEEPPDVLGSPETCSRLAIDGFAPAGSSVRWNLENGSDELVEIGSLSLDWPAENGQLQAVVLDGTAIWEGGLPSPARITEGWLGDAGDRSLDPSSSAAFELRFSGASAGDSGYITAVTFSNTCPVVDVR